jgi:leader peptidase (prepilin peptidase)/N-methyltransferase
VASFAIVAIGIFGLFIGSFLNVVVYRVPLKKSVVSPPSACPHCDKHIAWYDNIPLLSWLILRGKCRHCGGPISVRYPLIELGTGLFFAAITARFFDEDVAYHPSLAGAASLVVLVAFLYLGAISVALSIIDLETFTLPNRIVYPAYIVGLVLFLAASILSGDYGPLLRAAIAAAILFVLYFALVFFYPKGMGFGDVKLVGVLGLFLGWLGWPEVIVGSFAPFVGGGLFAIALLIISRAGRKSRIPFGPWLLAGAWVGIFVGDVVSHWYLELVGLV